jgi:O-antigen/teichoic acid export membrane protein
LKIKTIYSIALFTISPKVSQFIGIIVLPVITPYLTLKDYGIAGLINAYYAFLPYLFFMGQQVVLQNLFYDDPKFRDSWSRIYGLVTLSSIILSLIFIIILYIILPQSESGVYPYLSIAFLLIALVKPIDLIATTFFTLTSKPQPVFLASIVSASVSAVILIVCIKYLEMGYLAWFVSLTATNLIRFMVFSKHMWRQRIFPKFRLPSKEDWSNYKVGFKVIPHSISLYLFTSTDRIMLDLFKIPIGQIGKYSQGNIIGMNGNVLIDGIFATYSPKLHRLLRVKSRRAKELLLQLFAQIYLLAIIPIFLAGIWMKEIYLFLFRNPELREGYLIALVIMFTGSFMLIYAFVATILVVKKKTQFIARISMNAAICNIILNIIFIPKYGIWAAVFSTYISYLLLGLSFLFIPYCRGILKEIHKKFWVGILAILIANLLIFYLSWVVLGAALLYKVLITFVSLGVLLFLIRRI